MTLNEKIAKWCGFRQSEISSGIWFIPNTEDDYFEHGTGNSIPNFTESMDALIKWVVPNLWSWGIGYHRAKGHYHAHMFDGRNCSETIFAESDTPSMAFCLALEKYIDSHKG